MKTVVKPWGKEYWWAVTDAYIGKILDVKAGHSLSLQLHREKLESLFFARGRGRLVLGDDTVPIRPGRSVTIPPGTPHRISADTRMTIFEVSTPHPDDVVRLDDAYGRAGR